MSEYHTRVRFIEAADELRRMFDECKRLGDISILEIERRYGLDEWAYRRQRTGEQVAGNTQMKSLYRAYKFVNDIQPLRAPKINPVELNKTVWKIIRDKGYASPTACWEAEPMLFETVPLWSFVKMTHNPLQGRLRTFLAIARWANHIQFPSHASVD